MTVISGTEIHDIANSAQIHSKACPIVFPRLRQVSPEEPMHARICDFLHAIVFRIHINGMSQRCCRIRSNDIIRVR